MRVDAKTLLDMIPDESHLQPVTVTAVATKTVTVTLNGGPVTGVRIAGLTYTVGSLALALWYPPALPVILPTA